MNNNMVARTYIKSKSHANTILRLPCIDLFFSLKIRKFKGFQKKAGLCNFDQFVHIMDIFRVFPLFLPKIVQYMYIYDVIVHILNDFPAQNSKLLSLI